MSGEERAAPPKRNSAKTRERILSAARRLFSHTSYDNVGTREIAAEAGVDAALVNRYFGSKELLFAAALQGGFLLEEHLPPQMSEFGAFLARQILDEDGPVQAPEEFDALGALLHASSNPAIAALVAERHHAEFVEPLAALLEGEDRMARAGLISAQLIGLATMSQVLRSPAFADREAVFALWSKAFQALVDG